MANQPNSIWTASNSKPPRGKCNHKASILSSCPCLRFMLHPVKAATSFDCDGCGHHASFHSLENAAEEAILKKWSEQEANSQETTEGATKKRRRIAEKPADEAQVWELTDDDDGAPQSSTRKRTAKKSTVPVTVSAASRARNK